MEYMPYSQEQWEYSIPVLAADSFRRFSKKTRKLGTKTCCPRKLKPDWRVIKSQISAVPSITDQYRAKTLPNTSQIYVCILRISVTLTRPVPGVDHLLYVVWWISQPTLKRSLCPSSPIKPIKSTTLVPFCRDLAACGDRRFLRVLARQSLLRLQKTMIMCNDCNWPGQLVCSHDVAFPTFFFLQLFGIY